MTPSYELRKFTNRINLSMGDIIIDSHGHTGILMERRRHIDMVDDDIFVWSIRWNSTVLQENPHDVPVSSVLEEEGLKLSIVVGLYEWHSVSGETFDLEI